ncbi:hypothetical protein [Cellulomonas sp. S1-8]|uniref:hypothetical protein n=1 Tax=Cellulomonas sp. S1-8 TaxID=2904790 RepID=UPI002243B59C|nr:hypothetical protein [Cellulomonas sp. S1-8]UZN03500.1 hypothetical protein OKX07_00715 [Cellulomonas sp. S1-8]
MLEQPWPPPATGPQQPRDAHGSLWANDVRRARRRPVRPVRPASSDVRPDVAWTDLTGGAPATWRRTPDEGRELDTRTADGAERERAARPRPLPARWVPQEEWIPDPSPSPEQRWTPEQDWMSVFSEASAADVAAPPVGRSHAQGWAVLGAAVLPLLLVVAFVVSLL